MHTKAKGARAVRPASGPPPEYVSVPEFATKFQIGRTTVYDAIKAGKVKAIRLGGTPRIPYSEVERVSKSGW